MNEYLFDSKESANNISKLSVLYVEDDAEIRATVSRSLKRKVANLYTAANGKKALEQYKKLHPDLIITDIHMPEMDGIEMISRIREMDSYTPVIITIDQDDDFTFLRSIESEVDKFVTKPINSKNLVTTLQKIATLIVQQKDLRARNHFILALLDINPSYLAIYGDNGLIYLNQSFKRFLGVDSVAEFKERYMEFVPLIIDKDPELTSDLQLGNWAIAHTAGGKSGHMLQLKLPQNTEEHSFLLTTVPVTSTSQEYLLTFTDITQIEKEKQHYQFLAEYDALTKVFNRNKINKEMDKEITRVLRYRQRLSVLMIDVDHFKRVNDTYGHQVGDIVLIELSALIQDRIRKTDTLGRYGGEEFILLMPSTPLESAAEIANRLRKSIAVYDFTSVEHVTCSIGVAEYQPGESSSTFMKRSDDALYTAKRNGRNKVEVAT